MNVPHRTTLVLIAVVAAACSTAPTEETTQPKSNRGADSQDASSSGYVISDIRIVAEQVLIGEGKTFYISFDAKGSSDKATCDWRALSANGKKLDSGVIRLETDEVNDSKITLGTKATWKGRLLKQPSSVCRHDFPVFPLPPWSISRRRKRRSKGQGGPADRSQSRRKTDRQVV